jgi:undecaprenyl-diphosphooligosaccharide--protein glycosyltransferase
MKLNKTIHNIDNLADIYLIYMVDYGRFVIMDREMFNSSYVQLFVLENYADTPFEPVILDPAAKVYKLKR